MPAKKRSGKSKPKREEMMMSMPKGHKAAAKKMMDRPKRKRMGSY